MNEQFESLLDELFGARKIRTYREQCPSDWIALMNEFEGKKRGKRILDTGLMTNIRLPRSFVSLINESYSPALERYGIGEVKLKNNEYLSLSSGMMKKLFTPVVELIKSHLKTLMGKPRLSKVKIMLLVGGFADSAFLQDEIKKAFSRNCRVLIPHHANTVVVQGAVHFGKKPATISARVVSTTYGTDCTMDFIEGVHREEKKIIVDGVEMCDELFSRFVKEDAVVKIGQRICETYHPIRREQTRIRVGFYITTNPNTKYITEPEVTKIGSLVVQSPDTWRGKDREIEVSMYFGGTEITATALDISSGHQAQTTLDFFSRS